MHQRRKQGFEMTAVNQGRGRNLAWPGGEVSGQIVADYPDVKHTQTHTSEFCVSE